MKKVALAACCALSLAGCVQPRAEYTPVVDTAYSSPAKFQNDLAACRNLALRVEADYKERQQKEMTGRMIAGLLVGAALGAAVGNHDTAAWGAAYGATAGAATGDYTHDLVTYGPRRVIVRCMAARGHVILNDIGRG